MKTVFRNWSSIFALIAWLGTSIFGEQIDLKGKVIDEYGEPVSKAQLTLKKLNINSTTDDDGNFRFQKETNVINSDISKNGNSVRIHKKFLELGNYYNSVMTVFSISGMVLNRIVVQNQNRISIEKLVPTNINSQAVIISVAANNKKINIKSVKCGSQWLYNDYKIIENSKKSVINQTAAVTAVDTLFVQKSGKQSVSIPIVGFVATLSDIILFDPTNNNLPSMIGDVTFSEPSNTFKTSLSVTMKSKLANTEIRYTTDGTVPTASSTKYDGKAVTINQTTQLRAAAFSTGVITGKSSTAIYIKRNFDYTSDIPIVIMDGYGKGKPDSANKIDFIDLAFMTFEPVNGVASFNNPPTLVTRAGYHSRGQSSNMMFAQRPYRIELWDNEDKDADYPLLGMPSGSDWTMISPCTDNTLIRNVLIFDLGKSMGLATVQYRFAEVFINYDGGELEAADHEGIYTYIPPIKNRKNTLDLKKLDPEDTDPSKLSGGYIFKFDQMVDDPGMIKLECTGAEKITINDNTGGGFGWPTKKWDSTATCWDDLELVDPSEPNQQQIDWITNYVQEFHDALHAKPIGDWKKYIDLNTFINNHIINELTCNVDGWIKSHYMYKDRNQPIKAGPVWDYNFALGNFSTTDNGWHIELGRNGSGDWHRIMWQQSEYKNAVKIRYNELRKTVLSDVTMEKLVNDVKKPINNVAERNFDSWPMNSCVYESWRMMLQMMGGKTITDSTWDGQITELKTWLKTRLKTLDSLMGTLP